MGTAGGVLLERALLGGGELGRGDGLRVLGGEGLGGGLVFLG